MHPYLVTEVEETDLPTRKIKAAILKFPFGRPDELG
jgi:hypothetical protein